MESYNEGEKFEKTNCFDVTVIHKFFPKITELEV